ncbi:rhomboid family intramembrane serine protease [Ferrimonas balearica]|uniref:rhomboid family intramembrane serine protease n=1 Tax=Ferrimonas balearica TaxID=44012 RepID=UPI0031BBB9BC
MGRVTMARQCPQCSDVTMEVFDFHGEEVDECPRCGGLWFERGELDSALSSANNGDDNVQMEQQLYTRLRNYHRDCHACERVLTQQPLLPGHDLEVNACRSCLGVFVDHDCREMIVHSPQLQRDLAELNGDTGVKTWVFQFLSKMPVEFNIKPRTTPWLVYLLILINVAQFGLELAYPNWMQWTYDNLTLRPDQVMAGQQLWTLLTNMFIHGSVAHLLGNMYFLYVVGDNLEDVLGRWRFLAIYLACGLVGGVAQVLSDPGSDIPILGASGAVAGLFGMYLMWFRHASLTFMLWIFQKKLSPAWFFGIWLVINVIGVVQQGEGVAYWAHIGGFISGLMVGIAWRQRIMDANPVLAMLNHPKLQVLR